MSKTPADPNLETVTDLVVEFRIKNVPADAMERSALTVSMKAEIDALRKIVVEQHHGIATLSYRDRRQEKAKVVATPPVVSALTQDVANELAAEPLGETATADLPLQTAIELVHAPHVASDRRQREAAEMARVGY